MTTPQPEAILQQMMGGCVVTQLVYVAAKLGIADQLSDGPQGVEQLAATAGTDADSLYRILRALSVLGIFAERDGRAFELTPLAQPLRSAVPGSMRSAAITHGEELYRTWGGLLHNVETGQPAFEHVYGQSWWDYLDQHPDTAAVFNQRMTALHAQRNAAVAAAYDFSGLTSIVDVGGGQGSLLATILQTHPSVRGILFDLPHVVAGAAPLLEQAGVRGRCEIVGGDMFEDLPAGSDAYLLATVLHDWNDERAAAILRNCRRAMQEGGRLLVVEMVVPSGNEPSPVKLMDAGMMVMMRGRERTESEYRDLFARASFTLSRAISTTSPYTILEGEPA